MKIVCLKGGLGNQMFEYCRYRQLLDSGRGERVSLYHDRQRMKEHGGMRLGCFDIPIPKPDPLTDAAVMAMKALRSLHLFPTLYDDSRPTATLIDDYCQDRRFITAARQLFAFSDTGELPGESAIAASPHPVAVHIRRGDYLHHSNINSFGLTDATYFHRAIGMIRQKVPEADFFFFSDDIEWTRRNIRCDRAVYMDAPLPDWADMRLMTLCRSHVISNSTFSFWGAFLSAPGGINIYPSQWYADPTWQQPDIFPDNWTPL